MNDKIVRKFALRSVEIIVCSSYIVAITHVLSHKTHLKPQPPYLNYSQIDTIKLRVTYVILPR